MKTWKKILIIICVVFVFMAAYGGACYWYGCYVTNKNAREAGNDVADKGKFIPKKNTAPGTITMSDLRYYDAVMRFFIMATGPGSGEFVLPRPDKWMPPPPIQHILSIGIGGGYYCGYWLPGISLGYLYRIASLGRINVYIGPELEICAANARDVAVQMWLKAEAGWY